MNSMCVYATFSCEDGADKIEESAVLFKNLKSYNQVVELVQKTTLSTQVRDFLNVCS